MNADALVAKWFALDATLKRSRQVVAEATYAEAGCWEARARVEIELMQKLGLAECDDSQGEAYLRVDGRLWRVTRSLGTDSNVRLTRVPEVP